MELRISLNELENTIIKDLGNRLGNGLVLPRQGNRAYKGVISVTNQSTNNIAQLGYTSIIRDTGQIEISNYYLKIP